MLVSALGNGKNHTKPIFWNDHTIDPETNLCASVVVLVSVVVE